MYEIAVIPGDGIGPEVTEEARKTIQLAADQSDISLEFCDFPFGADHYLETEELIPDSALEELQNFDAIFLGAIGDERVEPGILERGIVGRLRWDLDLFVNVRPVRMYSSHLCPLRDVSDEKLDILVVRENTEGFYAGNDSRFKEGTEEEVALQTAFYSRKGTKRIVRYAFDRAQERNQQLTLVDKSNAIQAHSLYQEVFEEFQEQYPDVRTETSYVDAMSMWLIKQPEHYDTVVTTNMFGDIITDLGAMIQGGLGLAAGGNIHPGKIGMFEPIHGSAPRYKGENVASPIAAILAGKMMFDYLEEPRAAEIIDNAVTELLSSEELSSLSTGNDFGTDEMGEMVRRQMKKSES